MHIKQKPSAAALKRMLHPRCLAAALLAAMLLLSGCFLQDDFIENYMKPDQIGITPDKNAPSPNKPTDTPSPSKPTTTAGTNNSTAKAELLDYYHLAADMLGAYNAGNPEITDESDKKLDIDTALSYISMIIPRQIQLHVVTNWLDNKLQSTVYECEFYLPIDKDFDKVTATLHAVIDDNITPDMTVREKLLIIHDWVIEQNAYPDQYDDNSHSAAALVFYGNAVCSGYAEAVKIMCDYLEIPCLNVHGSAINDLGKAVEHAWNIVLIDGEWLHLDATFDDPIMTTGEQICEHDFFLVTTDEIMKNHIFDKKLDWDAQRKFADWFTYYY